MFLVKKAITAFLLPPGLFVLLLFCSGAWLARRKQWKTALFNVALALLFWIGSMDPVADLFMGGLEKREVIPASLQGDVIILLGGGISDKVRDLSGRGAPSEEALARLVTAVRAQKRTNLPVIVSGGAWTKDSIPEAPILKRFMIDLGVPAGKIISEDKSRDTVENARYCRDICARYGFRKPLLVTSAYHMRRAAIAFKKEGMKVLLLPANFKVGEREAYTWLHYLPSSGSFYRTATALHEYMGLLYYRLTL